MDRVAHSREPTHVPEAKEAEHGEHDGRTCARLGQEIPPLSGGTYAVGFLYGYRSEQRLLRAEPRHVHTDRARVGALTSSGT